MASFRTRTVGFTVAPTAEKLRTRQITGLSTEHGDGSNSAGAGAGDGSSHAVGGTSSVRAHIMGYQPIPTDVPRDIKVVAARQFFRVTDTTAGFVGKTVYIWAALRAFVYAITGATFQLWQTGSNWDQYGGDTSAPSLDAVTTPIASHVWTTDEHNAVTALTPTYIEADVASLLQELNDANEPLRYLLTSNQGPAVGTYLFIDNPATGVTTPCSYLTINYLNSIEQCRSNADGSMNRAALIDERSGAAADHIFLRSVNRGSSSPWSLGKTWVFNTRDTDRSPVFIDGGFAMAGAVDNSDATGGYLRFARPYNNTTAIGTGSPEGTFTLTFTATDTYDVTFLLSTAAAGATPETLATGLLTSADETIQRSGIDVLDLLADAFSGTIASGSVIRIDVRADRHDTDITDVDDLDDIYLARATGVDRNTPDTAHARKARYAQTQQLFGLDTSTIANSSGATGMVATVSDGGTWTHIKVADPAAFVVGEWTTLVTALDPDETGRLVDVCIRAVYPLGGGGSYEGQVRVTLNETGNDPVTSPGDFDGTSLLTAGIPLGKLTRPDETTLAVAANPASQVMTLAAPLEATGSVTVELFDYTSGTSQTGVAATASGTTLTFSGSVFPSMAFPIGSRVAISESTSNAPYFVSAQPAVSTTVERKRGYVVAEEFALVA